MKCRANKADNWCLGVERERANADKIFTFTTHID